MKIEYSPRFLRLYKKLPNIIKDSAEIKEKIFANNPFDSRLQTHKLQGRLKNHWAFSIDYKHRIVFSFVNTNTVYFYSVGDHSLYNWKN